MPQYPETIRYHYHPLKTFWFLPLLGISTMLMGRQLHKVDARYLYVLLAAVAVLLLLLCVHYIRILYWAITHKPILVLSQETLQMQGYKPVLWTDIADIEEGTVFLKDTYTADLQGNLNRLLGRRQQKIRLPLDLLKGKTTEIDEVLYEYHKQATGQA